MSETAPRNTSEIHPELPVISAAPDALQLERLDAMVGYDTQIAEQFEHEADQTNYEAFREQKIQEMLAESGITDSDDEEAHAQYELAKDVYMQVIMLDQDQWLTREDGADVARRNVVFRRLLAEYPTEPARGSHATDNESLSEESQEASSTPETTDEADDVDTLHEEGLVENARLERDALHGEAIIENARFDVSVARDEWSTVTARRQGKAFGRTKNHDQVRDNYHTRVQTLGILELEEQVNATDDDLEKNIKVIEYLFEEQRKLREQTIEKLNNTKVGRFVKFMNKGSFGMRLLKGVGVGVVVGGAGAMAFGAIGAAAGATAAVAASRFVKGYTQGDRHRGMTTAQEEFIDNDRVVLLEDTENDSVERRFAYAAKTYNEAYEDDTKKEQAKRRKALAWGVGSVAVGAGVGYALTNLDSLQGVKQDISDWVNGKSVEGNGSGGSSITEAQPEDASDLYDRDGDGYSNDTDVAPGDSGIGAVDFGEISRDARWIEHGEGGFQTLQELGVPEEKWEAVWADAGEHFADEGKAYVMEDGRYGWSDQGRLTNADIIELVRAARRQGVILDSVLTP